MINYVAPIKEIVLAMEVSNYQKLADHSIYEDHPLELVESILTEAGRFCADVLSPANAPADKCGTCVVDGRVKTCPETKEAYKQYFSAGWPSLGGPANFGGNGSPEVVAAAMLEMVSATNLSFSQLPALMGGAVKLVNAVASDELKTRYLEKMATGEWTSVMAMSEPQAGSDLSSIRTSAKEGEDGEFYIQGQKIWISWGDHDLTDNVVHLVLARCSDSPKGTRGLSLFLVPTVLPTSGKRNKVSALSVEHKLGLNGAPTCVIQYGTPNDSVDIGAIGWLVGKKDKGLQAMFTMMNSVRQGVGIQGVGLIDAAYQYSLQYAQERVQGTAPDQSLEGPHAIINHPDMQRSIARMKAVAIAGRILAFDAYIHADLSDLVENETRDYHRRRESLITPILKGWWTEMSVEITRECIQVYGGMGFVEETGVAVLHRDSIITPIYEGTTVIHANDLLFRKIIYDRCAAFDELVKEMTETVNVVARLDLGLPLHELLLSSIEKLTSAVSALIELNQSSQAKALAGARALLDIAGPTLGLWALTRRAIHLSNLGDTLEATKAAELAGFFKFEVLDASKGVESIVGLSELLSKRLAT